MKSKTLPGKLTAEDLESFGRLGISPELLELAGVERVSDAEAREKFGIRFDGDLSGLVFPYFISGRRVTARVRRDHPERNAEGKLENKYISAYGDRRHLYLPPDHELLLEDVHIPLLFVESEKAVLAVTEWSRRVDSKVLPIGCGGCWGWRGVVGIKINPNGAREEEKDALPEVAFAKPGRKCGILFDADAATNPKVARARDAFRRQLQKQGGEVGLIALPVLENVNGPDDFLAICGDEAFRDLLEGKYTPAANSTGSVLLGCEDTSNGERFSSQHHETVRFWHGRDIYLLWSGSHWAEDVNEQVAELAKQTARNIYLECSVLPDKEAARRARWAEHSLNYDKILAMLKSARSDPRIAMTTDKLDQDPFALNFLNGTVDLRTGVVRSHRREDYITKLVRFNFAPDLVAPGWELFLNETFGDGLSDWVQKAMGYSLTGSTREKVMFLLLGPTDAGKTTFLEVPREIFPDYSKRISIESLMWSKQQDNNTSADLADLRGARFAVTSEVEEGQRLRESMLKSITQGMGTIKKARKYENPIEFPETHKLWLDANFAPVIRGIDAAIWNRMLPIPCDHVIPKGKQDRELKAKLLREAEGIVSWVVRGAVRWYAEGLEPIPNEVERRRGKWRAEMDIISEHLAEFYVEDPQGWCFASEMYKRYCEKVPHPMSQTVFGERLAAKGFGKDKDPEKRRTIYKGLRLRDLP